VTEKRELGKISRIKGGKYSGGGMKEKKDSDSDVEGKRRKTRIKYWGKEDRRQHWQKKWLKKKEIPP